MRKLVKLPLLAAFVALAMLAFMGTAFAGPGGSGDAGSRANNCEGGSAVCAQPVLGSGSDTTYQMMLSLTDLYNGSNGCLVITSPQPKDFSCVGDPITTNDENYYHDYVTEAYPIGSGGGVGQLCSHGLANVTNIDFARSSRVPISSDCTGLHFVGYARDGVSWECFPGVSNNGCQGGGTATKPAVKTLSTSQLKKIFVACTVTNWNQVGGSNTPITVYVPQANSGTGVTWASFVGVNLAPGSVLSNCLSSGSNLPPGTAGSHVSFENTNQYIINNGDQKTAIFPFSIGVYNHTYGTTGLYGKPASSDGSLLGKINGVAPTPADVSNQSFPALRILFNVYCAGDPTNNNKCGTQPAAPGQVTDFVGENGWICNGENFHEDLNGDPDIDPWFGKPYRTATATGDVPNKNGMIPAAISNNGFVPMEKQSDGTYCQTLSS